MLKKEWALGASAAVIALFATVAPVLAADDDGLQEVVVTARRRAETLQSVPQAVSAFTADDMANRQVSSTLDLVRMVPNLFGSSNTGIPGANTYYIRGLGSTEQIATIDPAVSTYVDDVVVPRQNANNYGLFDIEQMEVLRGPQGTTFGRNSTGGAISVRLKKPSEDFGGYAEATYGSYEQRTFRGDINVPVTPKILTKFTGYYSQDDGWMTNQANGENLNALKSYGGRGAVRLLPNDDITVDLSVEHTGGSGTYMRSYYDDPTQTRLAATTSGGTGNVLADALANRGLGSSAQSTAVTANLEWRLPSVTLNAITGYRTINQKFMMDFSLPSSRTINPTPYYLTNDGRYDMVSQELKAVGSFFDDKLRYVAGLYYFNEDNRTAAGQVFGTSISCSAGLYGDGNMSCGGKPGYSSVRDIRNQTDSYAAYAQADLDLTDTITAIAGARVTHEVKALQLPATSYGGATTADLKRYGIATDLETNVITPKFGLNYKPMEDVLLFVSATNGYKGGGWNSRTAYLPQQFTAMKPETTWSYEAGVKSTFLDHKLQVNVTGFLADTKNLQLSYTTPGPIAGTTLSTQDNAGNIEVKGLEFEVRARPFHALDLFGTLGIQQGEYTYVNPRAQSFVSGTGAYVNAIDLSDQLSRFPKRSAAVGGTYTLPVPSWDASFALTAELDYTGGFWTTAANSAPSTLTPTALNSYASNYTLVNLSLTFTTDDDLWRVKLDCKNCGDKTYLTSVFNGYYYGEPRRVTATLTRRF
ncbi:TonB-dependent receptor [Nitrospirillum iridis]|uniref:Iron complex outermembrane receptor protein n=1 Tax=Nitrospirillum iridis TaxID=765888 RepID=A0A7X0B1Q3_9PROT|nr:TonB-dependent receptor [Nitrospirillum iridis]MBB6253090.1 iron complex outermembrane receptor protein [Nitrospirillum iridis]